MKISRGWRIDWRVKKTASKLSGTTPGVTKEREDQLAREGARGNPEPCPGEVGTSC